MESTEQQFEYNIENHYEALRFTDSYSRMGTLLWLQPRMHRTDWLTVLGRYWSVCDNVREHRKDLRYLLLMSPAPLLPMMNEEEQAVYEALPDVITIYRGCSARYLLGASWSLDKDVASKFPTLSRYRVDDPVIVTARVKKQDVLALKLDRGEVEVITFAARRTKVVSLA